MGTKKQQPYRFPDLSGQRFGRWLAMWPIPSWKNRNNRSIRWTCQCECGKVKLIGHKELKNGLSKSCGCLRAQLLTKHGAAKRGKRTKEYQCFVAAKDRCVNPRTKSFKNYGGRGIEFRFQSFEEYLKALGPRPSKTHTVDRKDNDGR